MNKRNIVNTIKEDKRLASGLSPEMFSINYTRSRNEAVLFPNS